MPAIRLRLTRIHNEDEKKLAMNTMGLFKFNEMTSTEMPNINEDKTRSDAKKKANHQRKDFIKTCDANV